jgi:hypothetical protein
MRQKRELTSSLQRAGTASRIVWAREESAGRSLQTLGARRLVAVPRLSSADRKTTRTTPLKPQQRSPRLIS